MAKRKLNDSRASRALDANPQSPWIQKETFKPFPIWYHPYWTIYRCNECEDPFRNIRRHFTEHPSHKGVYSKSLRLFTGILASDPEGEPYDLLSLSALTPALPFPHSIPFIPACDGFSCNLCHHFASSHNTLRRHFNDAHGIKGEKSGGVVLDWPITPQYLQRFFTSNANSPWFPSTPPPLPPPPTIPSSSASIDPGLALTLDDQDRDNKRRKVVTHAAPDTGIWLGDDFSSYESGLAHIEDRTELHVLLDLTAENQADEKYLKRLRVEAKLYFERTILLSQRHMDPSTRARLGAGRQETDDGHVWMPFRSLNPNTRASYIKYFVRILFMLIRQRKEPNPHITLDLLPSQYLLIDNLALALENEEPSSEPYFHPLLLSLLDDLKHTDFRKTVIGQFCMINNLQRSSDRSTPPQWIEVANVTPRMAQVAWGFRAVVCREILEVTGVMKEHGGDKDLGEIVNDLPETLGDDVMDEFTIAAIQQAETDVEEARLRLERAQSDSPAVLPPRIEIEETEEEMVARLTAKRAAEEAAIVMLLEKLEKKPNRPLGSMLLLWSKAKVLARNSPRRLNISWLGKVYDTLRYGAADITLDSLALLIATLTRELESDLAKLCFSRPFPSMPGPDSSIADSYSTHRAGSNFLLDPQNELSHLARWLPTLVFTDPELKAQFIVSSTGDGVVWNRKSKRRWEDDCDSFQKKLAVLIHLSYGNPSRSNEFAQLRLLDDLIERRSLFWTPEGISLMTGYHKSRNQMGRDKIIFRFIPPHISNIIISYISLVRPMEVVFLRADGDQERVDNAQTFLFHQYGKRCTAEHLTKALVDQFRRHLRADNIGVSAWRHINTLISKQYRLDLGLYDMGDEIQDIQRGHTSATARVGYARTGGAVGTLDTADIVQFRLASEQWWRWMGCDIAPGPMGQPVRQKWMTAKMEENQVVVLERELQTANTLIAKLKRELALAKASRSTSSTHIASSSSAQPHTSSTPNPHTSTPPRVSISRPRHDTRSSSMPASDPPEVDVDWFNPESEAEYDHDETFVDFNSSPRHQEPYLPLDDDAERLLHGRTPRKEIAAATESLFPATPCGDEWKGQTSSESEVQEEIENPVETYDYGKQMQASGISPLRPVSLDNARARQSSPAAHLSSDPTVSIGRLSPRWRRGIWAPDTKFSLGGVRISAEAAGMRLGGGPWVSSDDISLEGMDSEAELAPRGGWWLPGENGEAVEVFEGYKGRDKPMRWNESGPPKRAASTHFYYIEHDHRRWAKLPEVNTTPLPPPLAPNPQPFKRTELASSPSPIMLDYKTASDIPIPTRKILLSRLRAILGDKADFKTNQEYAAYLVYQQGLDWEKNIARHIGCIIQTGGGKTLLYMAEHMADIKERATVIIVPFVALREDLQRRAKEWGVAVWEQRKWDDAPPKGHLVFVAAENAVQAEFATWTGTHKEGILRIVMEENHVLVTEKYRKEFATAYHFAYISVPILFVTATLPTDIHLRFLNHLHLRQLTLFHPPTARPEMEINIAPPVQTRGKGAVDMVAHVKRLIPLYAGERYRKEMKVLVFVQSVARVDELAEGLECRKYYAKLPRKQLYLDKFKAEGGVLVTTSATSTGVDMDDVGMVIILDVPANLVTGVQEMGRGGRKGEIFTVVIQPQTEKIIYPDDRAAGAEHAWNWVEAQECRRIGLSRYFDAPGVVPLRCWEMEGINVGICDFCRSGPTPTPVSRLNTSHPLPLTYSHPSASGISTTLPVSPFVALDPAGVAADAAAARAENADLGLLLTRLAHHFESLSRDGCFICQSKTCLSCPPTSALPPRSPLRPKRNPVTCPTLSAMVPIGGDISRGMNSLPGGHHICFCCFLPQSDDHGKPFHIGDNKTRKCKYPHAVVELLTAGWVREEARLRKEFFEDERGERFIDGEGANVEYNFRDPRNWGKWAAGRRADGHPQNVNVYRGVLRCIELLDL